MRINARWPLLAATACLLAFAAVLECAYWVAPAARLDVIALKGLVTLDGSLLDPVAQLAAHSADLVPLAVMLAAVFAWGWSMGRRWEAFAALVLVGGANVATQVLKIALAHPRVQASLGPNQPGAEALPSGHATAAMSLALAAVVVAPARVRAPVASSGAAYVIAVSISILVLGWHFPSDVLGGLLIASASFFCVVAAIRTAPSRRAWVAAQRGAGIAGSRLVGELSLVALAGVAAGAVLFRADDVLAFARVHTVAAATALAIVAASAGLLASAALLADD
jgi:membrane-associated phospholipid phosphatase